MAHVNRCCDHVRNTPRNRHTTRITLLFVLFFHGGEGWWRKNFFFLLSSLLTSSNNVYSWVVHTTPHTLKRERDLQKKAATPELTPLFADRQFEETTSLNATRVRLHFSCAKKYLKHPISPLLHFETFTFVSINLYTDANKVSEEKEQKSMRM